MNMIRRVAGCCAALLLAAGQASACGAITDTYMPTVRQAAAYAGLDAKLVASVIWIESNFCQYKPGTTSVLTSSTGARGLGQLMPATARSLNVDPDNPTQNIYGTALYLRQMYDRFGNWSLALAAYNAGPTRVAEVGGIPTWGVYEYVYKVTATYQHLRNVTLP